MTNPPAVPRPDIEVEWYRRRRAERGDLPLPAGLRFHERDSADAIRVPVAPGPGFRGLATVWRWALVLAGAGLLVLLAGGGRETVVLLLLFAAQMALQVLHVARPLRRVVRVVPEGVDVGWWPVPLSSRRLVAREILEIHVRRSEHARESPQPEFDLWAVRPDGAFDLLVGSLTSVEHAAWLETWLERRLGIGDARAAAQSAAAGASGGAEGR